MSWTAGKLEDLVQLQRGFDITKAQQKPGNVPVVSSSGIKSFHNQHKVNGPGVVIGRKGTLGSVFFVEKDYWPHDTTLWSKDLKGNDPRFVAYFLKTQRFERYDTGNSNPTLNRNHIHSLEIQIPDHSTQKRISEVLAAYDDLIENNRRRIALLEEAARLIYREWFVHVRFPGHEAAKFENGLPAGWSKTTIGEHCPFLYGKALKADARVEGVNDVYGSSGVVGTHEKHLVDRNSIIIGRKGNVGSVFWSARPFWPIDTVYYIEPNNADLFTFYALQQVAFINTDVAVPGLNRDFAHSRELVLPNEELLKDFNSQAGTLMAQKMQLENQNQVLTKARDLLLPRLMDGRIAV